MIVENGATGYNIIELFLTVQKISKTAYLRTIPESPQDQYADGQNPSLNLRGQQQKHWRHLPLQSQSPHDPYLSFEFHYQKVSEHEYTQHGSHAATAEIKQLLGCASLAQEP